MYLTCEPQARILTAASLLTATASLLLRHCCITSCITAASQPTQPCVTACSAPQHQHPLIVHIQTLITHLIYYTSFQLHLTFSCHWIWCLFLHRQCLFHQLRSQSKNPSSNSLSLSFSSFGMNFLIRKRQKREKGKLFQQDMPCSVVEKLLHYCYFLIFLYLPSHTLDTMVAPLR